MEVQRDLACEYWATHELESSTTSRLDQVCDHRLECGEECPEQRQEQSPRGEVVVSVCSAGHGYQRKPSRFDLSLTQNRHRR